MSFLLLAINTNSMSMLTFMLMPMLISMFVSMLICLWPTAYGLARPAPFFTKFTCQGRASGWERVNKHKP